MKVHLSFTSMLCHMGNLTSHSSEAGGLYLAQGMTPPPKALATIEQIKKIPEHVPEH